MNFSQMNGSEFWKNKGPFLSYMGKYGYANALMPKWRNRMVREKSERKEWIERECRRGGGGGRGKGWGRGEFSRKRCCHDIMEGMVAWFHWTCTIFHPLTDASEGDEAGYA